MRVLSLDELDSVFGGGDTVTVTNLTGYTVNANVYTNGIAWSSPGGSPGFVSNNTGETGSAPCNANYFRALNALPSFSHLRCLASKVDYPGMGLDNTINVNMLNEFSAVTVSAA